MKRLAEAQLKVTAASESQKEALFPEAASTCLMDVGNASFNVVFFTDAASASKVRVCEQKAGSRFLYKVTGHTIDAASPMYWVVSGDVLISTNSAELDSSMRSALSGVRPPC